MTNEPSTDKFLVLGRLGLSKPTPSGTCTWYTVRTGIQCAVLLPPSSSSISGLQTHSHTAIILASCGVGSAPITFSGKKSLLSEINRNGPCWETCEDNRKKPVFSCTLYSRYMDCGTSSVLCTISNPDGRYERYTGLISSVI